MQKTEKLSNIVTIRWPVKAKLKGTKPKIFKLKIKIKEKVKGKDFGLNLCLIFSEITERIPTNNNSFETCHLQLGRIQKDLFKFFTKLKSKLKYLLKKKRKLLFHLLCRKHNFLILNQRKKPTFRT